VRSDAGFIVSREYSPHLLLAIDDAGEATVSGDYWIAETAVTYELWYAVYEWAVNGTGNDRQLARCHAVV
jgi:hypothetical protein